MSIYVTSDLHGQYKTFIKGLDEIAFSDSDTLYVIGDAIDRGPHGLRILMDIMNHDNMDLLIGNHEFLMLNSVRFNGRPVCSGGDSELWLEHNGGKITFEQYKHLKWRERVKLLRWLNNRLVIKILEINGKKFCLSHSYYYPEYENKKVKGLSYGIAKEIVWKSAFYDDSFFDNNRVNIYSKYPYIFITGHIPVQLLEDDAYFAPYKEGNVYVIDGGCAYTSDANEKTNNGAIFLRLDDMKSFSVPLQ